MADISYHTHGSNEAGGIKFVNGMKSNLIINSYFQSVFKRLFNPLTNKQKWKINLFDIKDTNNKYNFLKNMD